MLVEAIHTSPNSDFAMVDIMLQYGSSLRLGRQNLYLVLNRFLEFNQNDKAKVQIVRPVSD